MQISYNKLFKLLIDKGMKKTDLAKEAKLTPATLAKLSKQETVSMAHLKIKMYIVIVMMECIVSNILCHNI